MGLTATPTPTLLFHVLVGILTLLSGLAALIFKKGSRQHRAAGNVFFITMLLMTTTGMYLSILKSATITMIASALTFYLVTTSWVTIKRKEGEIGIFERTACILVLAMAVVGVILGLDAQKNPIIIEGFRVPPTAYYFFSAVAVFAAVLDIKVIIRQGITGAQRIARHLWRMYFALFIATSAIFLGNPQVFPESIRGTFFLSAPVVAVLALMVFWLIRVLFTNWYGKTWRMPRAGSG